MKNLAVFYCQECGYYAYFPEEPLPLCPKCTASKPILQKLGVSYAHFIRLDQRIQDYYISTALLDYAQKGSSPVHDYPHAIATMQHHITDLEEENKVLNDTVLWMHDTIWQLMREQRRISRGAQEAAVSKERKTEE